MDEPRWRVRRTPPVWWRRPFDRLVARADVTAPDGTRYAVKIVRNLPLRDSPLGPVDDVFLPQPVSLVVLLGTNVATRGRTGWTVQIVRPAIGWRGDQIVHARRRRRPDEVADLAVSLVERLQRGDQPWETDTLSFGERIRMLMHWD